MLKEFREFAVKGNMVDMAVGIIIGAAFGGVVQSLVENIFMPLISALLGAPDFSSIFWVLNRLRRQAPPAPAVPPPPSAEEKLLMEIRDLLKRTAPR